MQQALLRCSVEGDARQAEMLLRSGADPTWGNPMGQTALHIASLWGKPEVCEVLIKGKANINQSNKHGATPLHSAASGRGEPGDRAQAIAVLLKHGARRDARNQGMQMPIDCAEDEEVRVALGGQELHIHNAIKTMQLKALDDALKKHASTLDECNGKGETALYLAVCSGWDAGIKRLLAKKAHPDIAPYRTNEAPLHVAVHTGNVPAVKELLAASAEVDIQDRDSEADPRFSSTSFSTKPDEHCAPLHYASRAGNVWIVELLLQRKASVNISDSHHCTPLHYCLEEILDSSESDIEVGSGVRLQELQAKPDWNGQIASVFIPENREGRWGVLVQDGEEALIKTQNLAGPLCEDVLDVLLKAKADPVIGNHKDGMDRSLLHTAAMSGSAKLIGKAIGAGCPVDALYKGSTPLHLLARTKGDAEGYRVLLEAKADVNAKSSPAQSTPLDIASKNRASAEIIRLLGGETPEASKVSNASGYPSKDVSSVADLSREQLDMLFLG